MWKQLLAPLALVILIWIAISLLTTFFITNSEQAYQRLIRENVSSIEASAELRATAWRIVLSMQGDSKLDDVTELQRREEYRKSLLSNCESLVARASTPEERMLASDVKSLVSAVDRAIQSNRSSSKLEVEADNERGQQLVPTLDTTVHQLADKSEQLIAINKKMIDEAETVRKSKLAQLLFARNLTIFFGPLIGLVLGWLVARHLQKRVATLAITLRNAANSHILQVGEVSLRGVDDLNEAQLLSEYVTERLVQVVNDLDFAEKAVIQSERLAAVGELAAGVAHELRNPLTSVKLLLQHAAQEHASGNRLEVKNLPLILSEIHRMEETIQGLLDFTRPKAFVSQRHDIRVPLQRAINLMQGRAHAAKAEIAAHLTDHPVSIDGDAEQLHLVFVNLLINALESFERGSGVVVVSLHLASDQKTLHIEFRDNGCGIPSAIIDRLFEPFVTTKEKGTGLGLALCHRIIHDHDGSISAKNQEGGGACFRISLPVVSCSTEKQVDCITDTISVDSTKELATGGFDTCHR